MTRSEFSTSQFAASLISALALIGGVLGAVCGMLVVEEVPLLSPKRSAVLFLCGLVTGAVGYFRREKRDEPGKELLLAFSIAALIWGAIFIFSEVVQRRFVFYPGVQVRDQVAAIAVCTSLVIGVVLAGGRKPKIPGGESILLLCQIVAAISFLQCAQGRLLFSDDHPSFLYRFQELVHHFPSIPYYNIDWNGGYVAREFFATGAIGSFILFSPFIAAVGGISNYDQARVYSLIVPYLFVFLVPCSVYLASRLLGLSRTASSVAGVLALGPSLGYFEWILKYGTIGFALSAGLLPLVTVLALRLGFGPNLPRWSEVFSFVILTYFFLSWPLAAVTLVPVVIVWIFQVLRQSNRPTKQRWLKIAVFTALTGLLQLPTIIVLVRESKIADLAASNSLPGSKVRSLESARQPAAIQEDGERSQAVGGGVQRFVKRFQENLIKANPIILLFLLPGVFALGRGNQRRVILAVGAGAFALHLIGPYYKPQFELRRMIYPALFICSIIAAAGISSTLELFFGFINREPSGSKLKFNTAMASGGIALLSGLFFVSPITVSSIYLNRSIEKFQFAPPIVNDLSQQISRNGGNGRTFFLGFILHDLGSSGGLMQDGGHIAPLANFSGKPLYAFDFTHSKWSIVDPIPESYRLRGASGIEEFLDLVNATAVVTHQKEWVDYCRADPRYVEVFSRDRFRVFTRNGGKGSYFIKGAGRIEAASEGLKVQLETQEAVLKFRYFPRLRSAPAAGVELFAVPAFEEESGSGKRTQVNYIGVKISEAVLSSNQSITIGFFPE